MTETTTDDTQLRDLHTQGRSQSEIARVLHLPRSTVRDRLKKLGLSPAPQAMPPMSTECIPHVYNERIAAMLDDLGELVTWWQGRRATLEQVQDASRKTSRVTYFVEERWQEAIRRQADLDGQTITQVVNRAFQTFFGQM